MAGARRMKERSRQAKTITLHLHISAWVKGRISICSGATRKVNVSHEHVSRAPAKWEWERRKFIILIDHLQQKCTQVLHDVQVEGEEEEQKKKK